VFIDYKVLILFPNATCSLWSISAYQVQRS